jgi:hypothetical protein
LFVDARCRESIEEGVRVHKAFYRTLEYIRDAYPDFGANVMSSDISSELIIGEDDNGELYERDEDQALLVETWYKGEPLILGEGEENVGPGLHVIWWAGEDQRVYLKHANYVYFDPGEDAKFPYMLSQCYYRENSVWGYGEAYFLKYPQIVMNKTSELILEGHMQQALGQTFYREEAVTPKQKKAIEEKGSLPGMWFPIRDPSGIQRLYGQGAPASLQAEMVRLQKLMETIVGRFDISQGRTPGSVTAFRALSLLSARAQVRLKSKEIAAINAYEEVGSYINRLISRYYTERRAYRIIGEEAEKATKYNIFRLEDLLKVYVFTTGDTYRLSEFVPAEGVVEWQHYEVYSPEFDVICTVSSTLPTDRVFYMEMAKELYGAKLIDAEIFWYVMQNGRFPPFDEIIDKLRNREMEAQEDIGQITPEAILSSMTPDQQQRFMSLPPERQQQVIAQIIMGGGAGAYPQ